MKAKCSSFISVRPGIIHSVPSVLLEHLSPLSVCEASCPSLREIFRSQPWISHLHWQSLEACCSQVCLWEHWSAAASLWAWIPENLNYLLSVQNKDHRRFKVEGRPHLILHGIPKAYLACSAWPQVGFLWRQWRNESTITRDIFSTQCWLGSGWIWA